MSSDEGGGGEDLEFFKDSSRSFAFLSDLTQDDEPKNKKQKKGKEEKVKDDPQSTEDKYEEKRYKEGKMKVDETVHHMLPIKTDKGLEERSRVVKKEYAEETKEPVVEEKEEEVEEGPTSVAELYALRQRYITDAKQDIAKLCCAVTEDPYKNISALKKLRSYCTTEDNKAGQTVRKLSILSLTAVYNDILPNYRIKADSNLDALSSDVKVQHSYESDLLKCFQIFLDLLFLNLNAAFKSKNKNKVKSDASMARKNLGLLSLQCMCDLLANNFNFNLRTNMLITLIPYGTSPVMKGALAEKVVATVNEIFVKDPKGEASVEAVRLIAGLVKKKGASVNPDLISTLLNVRVVELGEKRKETKEELPDTSLLSKKQRRHRKEQAKVRRELLEAEASENKVKQSRLQAEYLDHIFVTYFRVLKQYSDTKLLPVALTGLSKFAHLINIDFFSDLFTCLKRIIKEDELYLDDSLNCVCAIFTILSGQGSVLDVDVGDFYALLYQKLLEFTPTTKMEVYYLLRRTLTAAQKRPVPAPCQMAMVKRLCTMSTQLNPEQCNIFLSEARKIIRSQPRAAQMLESDNDFGKAYYPEAPQPDQANAEGTILWELAGVGSRYCDKSARKTARLLTSYNPLSIKRSEVEYFSKELNIKKHVYHLDILNDDFPVKIKGMQNRRIKLSNDLEGKILQAEGFLCDSELSFVS